MFKKKMLLFAIMVAVLTVLLSVTVFAAGESIKFKVKGENDQKSISIDDFYIMSKAGNDRIITGIKAQIGKYTPDDIVEISLPSGILRVEITNAYPSIQSVIIDSYCDSTIKLSGLSGLKSISVLGTTHGCKFATGCVDTKAPLEQIIINTMASDKLAFEKNAFKDVSALKKIDFGTGNNAFTLNEGCFSGTGITEIHLVDNIKFTISGNDIFKKCANLEFAYLGKNVTTIRKGMFGDCHSLEMVYVSAANSIDGEAFKISSGTEKARLKVYVHTEKLVNLGGSAFDGRKTMGVTVCVLSTSTQSLSNCKYELHVGTQHEYYLASDESSCITTYATECLCGKVYNAYYKLYKNDGGSAKQENVRIETKRNENGAHSFTTSSDVKYENGFNNAGVLVMKCSICGDLDETERAIAPMVEFLGYSVSEFGETKSMTAGVRYDYRAIEQYEEATGSEVSFGMVASAVMPLEGNNPLNNNGVAYSDKVRVLDMSSAELVEYDAQFKLSGLTEAMLDTEFVISAYVIIGREVKYYQGEGALKNPQAVTYSQLINN